MSTIKKNELAAHEVEVYIRTVWAGLMRQYSVLDEGDPKQQEELKAIGEALRSAEEWLPLDQIMFLVMVNGVPCTDESSVIFDDLLEELHYYMPAMGEIFMEMGSGG